MPATSPYNCTAFVVLNEPSCAPEEGARVRHLILLEAGELPANSLAMTSAFFLTKEAAGTAIIYRNVSGSYATAPKTGAGFGNQQERITGIAHTLDVEVPQLLGNEAHAESLMKRGALYVPIWFSESRMWVGPANAQPQITPGSGFSNSTDDLVTPKLTIAFNKKALVRTYTGFDLPGLLSGTATAGAGGTTSLPVQN